MRAAEPCLARWGWCCSLTGALPGWSAALCRCQHVQLQLMTEGGTARHTLPRIIPLDASHKSTKGALLGAVSSAKAGVAHVV